MLSQRAMGVQLHVSKPRFTVANQKKSRQACRDANAKDGAIKVQDALWPKESVAKITAAESTARTTHRELSLPWGNDGTRILVIQDVEWEGISTNTFDRYIKSLDRCKNDWWSAVHDHVNEYENALQTTVPNFRGTEFRLEDYPSKEVYLAEFKFEILTFTLATNAALEDLRLKLGENEIKEIEKQTMVLQNRAVEAAWGRLSDVVGHMKKTLSDPKAKYKNTLVTNIKKQVELLKGLNLTNDPNLDRMTAKIEAELSGLDPEVLRKDEGKRKKATKKASDILSDMAGYCGSNDK